MFLEVEDGIRIMQEDIRIEDEDLLAGWWDQIKPPGLQAPYHQAAALARAGIQPRIGVRMSPLPEALA
jgi:hypothetical protein